MLCQNCNELLDDVNVLVECSGIGDMSDDGVMLVECIDEAIRGLTCGKCGVDIQWGELKGWDWKVQE